MKSDQPSHETFRLGALRHTGILDTIREPVYDDIAAMAARLCVTPYAAVNFLDENRCWFKSVAGFRATQCDRKVWYKADPYKRELVVISEARPTTDAEMDTAFPHFQFYAGAPIVSGDGYVLGTVCVMDVVDRELTIEQSHALVHFAQHVSSLIELKVKTDQLEISTVKVQMLSDRDDITGLPSERMFRRQLRTEFQYARRHNQPVSLILLDIDDFTHFNQEYGIERGDRVLKLIARIVNRDTRDYDLVARSGSDEFAVVMRNAKSDTAASIAHRLMSRVAAMDWSGQMVTVSAGVATISPDMIGSKDLIDRAKRVLTDSLTKGRSMVGEAA